jgi:hypothetical protein
MPLPVMPSHKPRPSTQLALSIQNGISKSYRYSVSRSRKPSSRLMSENGKIAQYALSTAERLPLALRHHAANEIAQARAASSTLVKLPYEILQAILLQLPMQDLLLSQRICQRFRYMVSSSKPIRRALFLEPAHHDGRLGDWRLLKFNAFLTNQLAGSFHTRVIGLHRGKEGTVKMVAHMRYEKEALLDDDWADVLLYEHASWKSMLVRGASFYTWSIHELS